MSDNLFRSNILVNCFMSAVYLAYSSTAAYYYNEAKTLSSDSQSFESMFYVSLVIAGLSFIGLFYYSYKLLLLETEVKTEPVNQTTELKNFDLNKLKQSEDVRTGIFENPEKLDRRTTYVQPRRRSMYPPAPPEDYDREFTRSNNFGSTINSGGF